MVHLRSIGTRPERGIDLPGFRTVGRIEMGIDAMTISRQHIELRATGKGNGLVVRALHRNPIRVLRAGGDPDGLLLSKSGRTSAELGAGDLIEVGDVRLHWLRSGIPGVFRRADALGSSLPCAHPHPCIPDGAGSRAGSRRAGFLLPRLCGLVGHGSGRGLALELCCSTSGRHAGGRRIASTLGRAGRCPSSSCHCGRGGGCSRQAAVGAVVGRLAGAQHDHACHDGHLRLLARTTSSDAGR